MSGSALASLFLVGGPDSTSDPVCVCVNIQGVPEKKGDLGSSSFKCIFLAPNLNVTN